VHESSESMRVGERSGRGFAFKACASHKLKGGATRARSELLEPYEANNEYNE